MFIFFSIPRIEIVLPKGYLHRDHMLNSYFRPIPRIEMCAGYFCFDPWDRFQARLCIYLIPRIEYIRSLQEIRSRGSYRSAVWGLIDPWDWIIAFFRLWVNKLNGDSIPGIETMRTFQNLKIHSSIFGALSRRIKKGI